MRDAGYIITGGTKTHPVYKEHGFVPKHKKKTLHEVSIELREEERQKTEWLKAIEPPKHDNSTGKAFKKSRDK